MPVRSADSNGAKASAARMSRLLAQVRREGMLAPANLKGSQGAPTPAQRSAAAMGVGDNLRAALTDSHTAAMPMAPSWVDHMMADLVNGDGSIDPGLAFVKIETKPLGSSPSRVANPYQLAAMTTDMISAKLGSAIAAHGGRIGG